MRSKGNLIFALVDRDFYETIDRYPLNADDFVQAVREMVGEGWRFGRNGVWMHCVGPVGEHPVQGWKIHVSSTIENAQAVLKAVVPILRDNDINFKFALDKRILLLMNGKNWARGGAGKFITIYPPSTEKFLSLLVQLHAATSTLTGPYVLSDRRYLDSKVIHYRYGGLQSQDRFDVKGEKTPVIQSPDGEEIADRRTPFFQLPSWISDPVQPAEPLETSVKLKDGRYTVEQALAFSNCGGVYLANDSTTGEQVVIKEARPYVGQTFLGNDAQSLLEKEYRLLKKLDGKGIAPRAIDLFHDWEHLFLVEEQVKGMALRSHASIHSIALKTRRLQEDIDNFYSMYRGLFTSLSKAVATIHDHGIVFGDLSPNNVIIDKDDSSKCYIIDFEAACELGVDQPTHMFTPGFGTIDDIAGNKLGFEADYFALGAMMLSYFMPINGILNLKPEAAKELLDSLDSDMGVPTDIREAILGLMDKQVEKRPKVSSIAESLSAWASSACATRALEHKPLDQITRTVNDARNYILGVADTGRADRLFPADPRVFTTNPMSIAYGACGTLLGLKHTGENVPSGFLDWALQQDLTDPNYPPGLFLGLSGIARTFLDLGQQKKAESVLAQASRHPFLDASADIFYGLAGWGLTNLHFFSKTQNEQYLHQATRAAEILCQKAETDEKGNVFWRLDEEISLGLGHGASGIALFLLYAYLATNNERYLWFAERGLAFDLSHAVETKDGGLSWPYTTASSVIVLPYWKSGSAGVGCSVLRFYRLFQNEHYQSILDRIHIDTDRKYSIIHGQFIGLSGIGSFMLDAYDLLGNPAYLEGARNLADSIMMFAIPREQGTAFPDEGLTRISCDYGTGSAGTMLFLNRLAGRQSFSIFLDHLFAGPQAAEIAEIPGELVAAK